MIKKHHRFVRIWLATVIVGCIAVSASNTLPDFNYYKDFKTRKEVFVTYLLPKIDRINNRIKWERAQVVHLYARYSDGRGISPYYEDWVINLAEDYGIPEPDVSKPELWYDLMARVNIVPPSLALSQAAIESAWGTSRFAREGNNLFGQWCFFEGCGIVPQNRDSEASHEVAAYVNPEEAVETYVHNLNTNQAYKAFRDIREKNQELDGYNLASGLSKYSGIGNEYIGILRTTIVDNDLTKFDNKLTSR